MSIFASETRATIPIPFAAPHTVTIQKLTGQAIERAQGEHLNATIAGRSPRGWAATFQSYLKKGIATDADAEKAIADPLAGFDRLTVVREGVKAWTFTVTRDGKEMPRSLADIADLDDEAMEFLAVEVMRLTKPHLFQTEEEAKAAQKNA